MEDDHVAVDGEERQKTSDWNQEENATCSLQAWAAESHEKLVSSWQDDFYEFNDLKMELDDKRPEANIRSVVKWDIEEYNVLWRAVITNMNFEQQSPNL